MPGTVLKDMLCPISPQQSYDEVGPIVISWETLRLEEADDLSQVAQGGKSQARIRMQVCLKLESLHTCQHSVTGKHAKHRPQIISEP